MRVTVSIRARNRALRTTLPPPPRQATSQLCHHHHHPRPSALPPEVNFCLTDRTYRLITSSRPTQRLNSQRDEGRKNKETLPPSLSPPLSFSLCVCMYVCCFFIFFPHRAVVARHVCCRVSLLFTYNSLDATVRVVFNVDLPFEALYKQVLQINMQHINISFTRVRLSTGRSFRDVDFCRA